MAATSTSAWTNPSRAISRAGPWWAFGPADGWAGQVGRRGGPPDRPGGEMTAAMMVCRKGQPQRMPTAVGTLAMKSLHPSDMQGTNMCLSAWKTVA
jgi:hypothetical protein